MRLNIVKNSKDPVMNTLNYIDFVYYVIFFLCLKLIDMRLCIHCIQIQSLNLVLV